MAIQILIKMDGQPPQELTGLKSFALVAVPEKNPNTDTSLLSGGMSPKNIAECGAFMIRLSKSMVDNTELKPLGQPLSASESRIIKPRGKHNAINN